MVVEDEEDSRVMLESLLEEQGHTVVSALNGKNALELLKDSVLENEKRSYVYGKTPLETSKDKIKMTIDRQIQ